MANSAGYKDPLPSGSRATVVRGRSASVRPYMDDKDIFGGQNFDKYALLGAIAVLQQGVMNARGEGEGEVDGQETVSGGELRPVENPV